MMFESGHDPCTRRFVWKSECGQKPIPKDMLSIKFTNKIQLILVLGFGFLLGCFAGLLIFFDHTGRGAVNWLRDSVGRSEVYAPRFSYGRAFERLYSWHAVRSPTNPQWNVRPGFDLKLVAEGLDYPVNLAFVPKTGPDPDSPVFYVNELHGKIKYVGRDGLVRTYAEGLTNFSPIRLPKSDETGLSGLMLVPGTEDLLVTGAFKEESSGLLQNRILRLRSEPGGKRAQKVETVRVFDEFTSASNQIQQAMMGPDGKLYVSVGDAENFSLSLDLGRYGGKILRLNLDGTACESNPFYDKFAPESPRSSVFASGVRNVFDFDFDATGKCYAVDNGTNIDRLLRVVAGGSYGWNGDPESIRLNALYTWGPVNNTAPVGLAILARATLGEGTAGHCYVALFGPAAGVGANHGKAIVEFILDAATGTLGRAPDMLVQYAGDTKATVLGLAEGPDGLYFTDYWGETVSTDDSRGRVYKVVPSKATLGLPAVGDDQLAAMPAEERGRLYFHRNCTSCHQLDGTGRRKAPDLTHVFTNLDLRLNSAGYVATAKNLINAKSSFMAEQRPKLKKILEAEREDRIKVWLPYHLAEPRFDNPFARCPVSPRPFQRA